MASNVSNAVGTQRQFTAQPQDVYAKRLVQVNSHVGGSADAGNDGLRLAQSLGVLGNALGDFFESAEKRKEKIGIAVAEKVAASMSDEDMRTKTALDMLSANPHFKTTDNPYAIALIEKMRGKYLASKFSSEYDVYRKEKGMLQDGDAEANQFKEFMTKKYGEVSGVSTNQEAFSKGFHESFLPQQIEKVNIHLKERSEELDVQRVGGISASLGEITMNYQNLTLDQKMAKFKDILTKAGMSKSSPGERIELVNKFLEEYVERSGGDIEFLEALQKNGTLGLDSTGKEIKVSEVMPNMAHFMRKAEVVKAGNFTADVQEAYLKLSTMKDPVKIQQWFMETEKTNNHLYQSMVKMKDTLIGKALTNMENQQKKDLVKLSMSKAEDGAFKLVQRHLGLFIAGDGYDLDNNPRANSISDFAGKIKHITENGKEADFKIDKDLVNKVIKNEIGYIQQSSKTPEEAAARTMKVLAWGVSKDFAEGFKSELESTVDSVTLDKLTPKVKENLESAKVMYMTDQERFRRIFGKDTSDKVEAVLMLAQGTGSMERAVELYAQSRDNRNNKDFHTTVKAEIDKELPLTSMNCFKILNGNGAEMDLDSNVGTNQDLMKRVDAVAETIRLTGNYNTTQAISMALKGVKDNYLIYGNTAIPKNLINGFQVDNKEAMLNEVIEDARSMFATNKGLQYSDTWVDFNEDRGLLVISGGNNKPFMFSIRELTNYGNKKGAEWLANGGGNITLEQGKNARANKPWYIRGMDAVAGWMAEGWTENNYDF